MWWQLIIMHCLPLHPQPMLQWALHSDILLLSPPHPLHMDHYHSLEFHLVPYRCTPTCGEHRQSSHWQSEVSTEIEKKHVTRCEVAVSFYFKHANQTYSGAQCTGLFSWIACVYKLRMYCTDFAAGKVRSYFSYSLGWCIALVAGPPEAAHRLHTSKWCLHWESVPTKWNTFHTAVMKPLSVMMRIWLMSQLRQPPNVLLMILKEAKVLPQFTEIEWLPHVSFLALAISFVLFSFVFSMVVE